MKKLKLDASQMQASANIDIHSGHSVISDRPRRALTEEEFMSENNAVVRKSGVVDVDFQGFTPDSINLIKRHMATAPKKKRISEKDKIIEKIQALLLDHGVDVNIMKWRVHRYEIQQVFTRISGDVNEALKRDGLKDKPDGMSTFEYGLSKIDSSKIITQWLGPFMKSKR